MPALLTAAALPATAPARVLGCGAFLKNAACLLDGSTTWWSPPHGDLASPEACRALDASISSLVDQAGGPLAAIAHDLHPDMPSTRLAGQWAQRLGVPAIAVQHHHAHVAVVQAGLGWADAAAPGLIGLALDGVGMGTDGRPWGGELLWAQGPHWRRLAHLAPLKLPGGDRAAREPWRLAAAVLHAGGRAAEIGPRLGPTVGDAAVRTLTQMLDKGLNCPETTSAGRWFDAAAGALGLCLHQATEAEAAVALEQAATQWLQTHRTDQAGPLPPPSLDLQPLVLSLLDEPDAGRGAARFHLALAQGLVQAAQQAALQQGCQQVALVGGCFFNRLLTGLARNGLSDLGLQAILPGPPGPGDAGLALGQAWAAALQVVHPHRAAPAHPEPTP